MKNLFSEQRLIHFAASVGPEAGKNTPEPTVEATVDTPDAAANSINNAVEGLDGATQKELANLGIKKEELRGKNIDKLEKASDGTKFIEGAREVANALSEIRQIMQMLLKFIDMINNPDKYKQKPGKNNEKAADKPATSISENADRYVNVQLTPEEEDAVRELKGGEPDTKEGSKKEQNKERETGLENERADAVKEKRGLEDQKTNLESELRDTEDEGEKKSLQRQIDKLGKQITAVDEMIADVDAELKALKSEPEDKEDSGEALKSAREKMQAGVDQANEMIQDTVSQMPEGPAKDLAASMYITFNPDTFEVSMQWDKGSIAALNKQGAAAGVGSLPEDATIQDITDYTEAVAVSQEEPTDSIEETAEENTEGESTTVEQKERMEKMQKYADNLNERCKALPMYNGMEVSVNPDGTLAMNGSEDQVKSLIESATMRGMLPHVEIDEKTGTGVLTVQIDDYASGMGYVGEKPDVEYAKNEFKKAPSTYGSQSETIKSPEPSTSDIALEKEAPKPDIAMNVNMDQINNSPTV